MERGDIPYFIYQINSKDIMRKDGKIVKDFFEKEPYDIVTKKLNDLNIYDMVEQCELIQMSTGMITKKNYELYMNHTYKVKKNSFEKMKNIEILIQKYTKKILEHAVWNEERSEVNWIIAQVGSSMYTNLKIKPMGYYLYDGLSGMLLLLEVLRKNYEVKGVESIVDTLQKMLFCYTENGINNLKILQSQNTGAYDGESSIVYTYLTLYEITANILYLKYAEIHIKIVKRLLDMDKKYDLVNGNAGAIMVLMKMYRLTKEKSYLENAKYAVNLLENSAVKMKKGIGWITGREKRPMAGMAHGNAGILMAIMEVWEVTKSEHLMRLTWEIWKYENSLYTKNTNNWKDIRGEEESDKEIGSVAWCHGAAGVLISRLAMVNKLDKEEIKGVLNRDIERAYKKLKDYWRRDSCSLCHGSLGNLLILEEYEKHCLDKSSETDEIFDIQVPIWEKINPGLMSGYGGILYYLLRKQGKIEKNLLVLE